MAPRGVWEDHETRSKETQVLILSLTSSVTHKPQFLILYAHPYSSFYDSLGVGHWSLFVYFLNIGKI